MSRDKKLYRVRLTTDSWKYFAEASDVHYLTREMSAEEKFRRIECRDQEGKWGPMFTDPKQLALSMFTDPKQLALFDFGRSKD